MTRTIPALRQAVYAALTSPVLQYSVNNGAPQSLPAASVFGAEPVDVPDPKPDPLLSVTVGSRGRSTLALPFRDIEIKVSVSSGLAQGASIVTEIYAAALARLESTDGDGVNTLSRAAGASTLAALVPTIREESAMPAGFEPVSQRWYVTATLRGFAQ